MLARETRYGIHVFNLNIFCIFPTHGSQPQNNVLLKLKFVTGISGITKNCGFEWKGSGLVSSVRVLHAALFRFYRRRESGVLPANLAFIVPSFKESMTSCWTIWCWLVGTVWFKKAFWKDFLNSHDIHLHSGILRESRLLCRVGLCRHEV